MTTQTGQQSMTNIIPNHQQSVNPVTNDNYSHYQQQQQQQQHYSQHQQRIPDVDESNSIQQIKNEPHHQHQQLHHHPFQPHSHSHHHPSLSLPSSGQPLQDGNQYDVFNTIGHNPGLCALVLTVISVILIVLTLPLSLFFCIKVVQEYERAVIFRLGRLVKGGAKGPGIFFIIPCIDTYSKVDLRTVSFDVPPQEILSKDSVTVAVDAVVYYRISNATIAVSNVEDYGRSTRLLAATTLRNVLGTKNLSEILSERESISHVMQSSLDEATDPWGVKVERVEIKDARLPVQLQRAMATEAEAAREARAKVIAAEGEQRASRALKEAAEVIHDSPAALQLRYLQTLNSIAAEKNSTIVFPLPIDLFRGFLGNGHWDRPSSKSSNYHKRTQSHEDIEHESNSGGNNQQTNRPKVTFPDDLTMVHPVNGSRRMSNVQTKDGSITNSEPPSPPIQSQPQIPSQSVQSSSSSTPSQLNNQYHHTVNHPQQSIQSNPQFETQRIEFKE